jgi:ATP-binding cassette subfamily C protein
VAALDAAAWPLRDVHLRLAGHPASVRLLFDSGMAAILCVAAYLGLNGLAMRPAELFVLLVLFMRLAPHLALLQVYYQTLATGLPAFEAITRLEAELGTAAMLPAAPPAPHQFSGAVALQGVSFSYGREPVLDDVTIDVPAGATVALVGASGAGKTTVADLVLGLLRPGQGSVLVDGRPLGRDLESAWRLAVGYVPQDAFLFHDSIRRNLIWARPGATEDEVVGALRQASAEFVLRLPDGLDTVVGDRGVLLSAGQRQRVALARALLRQPALLVLDEATSALDSENERAIQAATRSLHGRVTVLVIAHRLSTVREADRIHVLEAGRVVEAGTWSELVSRSEGRFRALCEAQGVTVGR